MAKKIKKLEKIEKKRRDLLYMTPSDLTAKEMYEQLNAMDYGEVDYWEALNVIEIECKDKDCIDMEQISTEFQHESDRAFIKNRKIKSIFVINVGEDKIEIAKDIFMHLISIYKGFLCSDTDDFQPFYIE